MTVATTIGLFSAHLLNFECLPLAAEPVTEAAALSSAKHVPRRNDFSGNPLEVQNNVLRRLILCDDDGYYIIETCLTAHC